MDGHTGKIRCKAQLVHTLSTYTVEQLKDAGHEVEQWKSSHLLTATSCVGLDRPLPLLRINSFIFKMTARTIWFLTSF